MDDNDIYTGYEGINVLYKCGNVRRAQYWVARGYITCFWIGNRPAATPADRARDIARWRREAEAKRSAEANRIHAEAHCHDAEARQQEAEARLEEAGIPRPETERRRKNQAA